MATLQILLSCMHQSDMGIAQKSNIQTDAVIVNQCDIEREDTATFVGNDGAVHRINMYSTPQRGLSRSRNMALRYAESDLCLIADDDEILEDNAAQLIKRAFEEYPKADVITFRVKGSLNYTKKYAERPTRIGYLKAMQTSSVQIAFRRKAITENGIGFDEEMGAGTGHGGGEEIKFLFDCLHKNLKIQYVPHLIATLKTDTPSSWFKGYTPIFFRQQGWATRRYLGLPLTVLYSLYFTLRKRKKYSKQMTFLQALSEMLKGTFCGL